MPALLLGSAGADARATHYDLDEGRPEDHVREILERRRLKVNEEPNVAEDLGNHLEYVDNLVIGESPKQKNEQETSLIQDAQAPNAARYEKARQVLSASDKATILLARAQGATGTMSSRQASLFLKELSRQKKSGEIDIIDAQDEIEAILKRHGSDETAAIAASIVLGEDVVMVQTEGNGALHALLRTAANENMDIEEVDLEDSSMTVRKIASIVSKLPQDLISAIDAIPHECAQALTDGIQQNETEEAIRIARDIFRRRRLVIVKGVVDAPEERRKQVVSAVVNRETDGRTVAPDIVFAFVEKQPFSPHDLPTQLLLEATLINLDVSGAHSALAARNEEAARRGRITAQANEARQAGDEGKARRLEDMLARMPATAVSRSQQQPQRLRDESRHPAAAAKPGEILPSRFDTAARAATILDCVVFPDPSDERRVVIARKLLVSLCGEDEARAYIDGYLRASGRPEREALRQSHADSPTNTARTGSPADYQEAKAKFFTISTSGIDTTLARHDDLQDMLTVFDSMDLPEKKAAAANLAISLRMSPALQRAASRKEILSDEIISSAKIIYAKIAEVDPGLCRGLKGVIPGH